MSLLLLLDDQLAPKASEKIKALAEKLTNTFPGQKVECRFLTPEEKEQIKKGSLHYDSSSYTGKQIITVSPAADLIEKVMGLGYSGCYLPAAGQIEREEKAKALEWLQALPDSVSPTIFIDVDDTLINANASEKQIKSGLKELVFHQDVIEFLKRVKQIRPDVPLVILTARESPEYGLLGCLEEEAEAKKTTPPEMPAPLQSLFEQDDRWDMAHIRRCFYEEFKERVNNIALSEADVKSVFQEAYEFYNDKLLSAKNIVKKLREMGLPIEIRDISHTNGRLKGLHCCRVQLPLGPYLFVDDDLAQRQSFENLPDPKNICVVPVRNDREDLSDTLTRLKEKMHGILYSGRLAQALRARGVFSDEVVVKRTAAAAAVGSSSPQPKRVHIAQP